MLLKLSNLSRRLIKNPRIPSSLINSVLKAAAKETIPESGVNKNANSPYHVVQSLTDKHRYEHNPYVSVAIEVDEEKLVQPPGTVEAKEGPYVLHHHLGRDAVIDDPSVIVPDPIIETTKFKSSETSDGAPYKVHQELVNDLEVDNPFAPTDPYHQHHQHAQESPYAVHHDLAHKSTSTSSKVFSMNWLSWRSKSKTIKDS